MANRSLKALSLLLVFGIVGACGNAPLITRTSGTFNKQKYVVTLSAIPDGINENAKLEINDTEILFIESAIYPNRDSNCVGSALSGWNCRYTSSYKGLPISIDRRIPVGGSGEYDVYLSDEFLANVRHSRR